MIHLVHPLELNVSAQTLVLMSVWYKRQNSEKSKAAPMVFSGFTTVAQDL